MHGVAGRAVDDARIGDIFPIVYIDVSQSSKEDCTKTRGVGSSRTLTDEDGPDVNKGKQDDIRNLVKGKDEGKHMIRYTLGETVEGVKGMARVWGGHYPFVMRFVQSFVNSGVMQTAMDPVDEEVGETDEQGELEDVVQPKRGIGRRIVQFGISLDFANKKGDGKDGHDGKRLECLLDLKGNLVLEVFRVGEGSMVEDEEVGEGGTDEVDDKAKEPKPWVVQLSPAVFRCPVSTYQVMRYKLRVCLQMLSLGHALRTAY